jgi:nucleobase:cation symporter-1, NCS1 family
VALVGGIAVALIGLVAPPLHWLYDYAWFVGFFTSGLAYVALMQRSGEPAVVGAYASEEA